MWKHCTNPNLIGSRARNFASIASETIQNSHTRFRHAKITLTSDWSTTVVARSLALLKTYLQVLNLIVVPPIHIHKPDTKTSFLIIRSKQNHLRLWGINLECLIVQSRTFKFQDLSWNGYTVCSKGPITEPCGTPANIISYSDCTPIPSWPSGACP